MAGIRKRTWINKSGKHVCYEINCIINGVQVRRSGYKTKQEAQAALSEVTKEITSNIKFTELCRYYLEEHCQLHCKDSTLTLYRGYYKNNLTNFYFRKAKDIQKRDIDLLILEYKRLGLSNKTINNIIGFLRSVFSYGINNKWLSSNPAKEVKKLPKITKEIRYLTTEEMQQFLEIIKGFPICRYAALLTDLYTGMRISELLAIEWSDIDFKNGTILVNKQFYKGRLSAPKTYKSTRRITIPEAVINVLKQLKAETKVLSKIVFCGKDGNYLNQDKFVMNWFKKAMKIMEKPEYNFHCLRHTYATYLLSNGVPIKFVQEQLGHSTAQTTLNVYSHIMPNVNKEAMNLFNKLQIEHDLNMMQN